jgi:hypothetical protein
MDKYQLPWWMQWLQAIALILIPIGGAWLAFKQVCIAEAKLNLDLYEKRFNVFETARKLLAKAVQHANVDTLDIHEFNLGVLDAGFLFDDEIENYLDGLRERAARLKLLNSQLEAVVEDQKRRAKLADRQMRLLINLTEEIPVLKEKFKPYLRLGLIKTEFRSR